MAAPITILGVVQGGVESARGTLVPATSVLDHTPGEALLRRDPHIIRIRKAGSLATSHRTYPGQDEISVEVSGTWSYNWAPWWFNLFLGPLTSGTGAGANKTWTFDNSVVSDTSDNLGSVSLEVGGKDTWAQEYKIAGCVGSKLSLSIKQDAPWTYKATLMGQALTIASKTGALTPVSSIVDVLGTTTKVYLNSTGSAFGNTQKSGTVVSADIDISLGMNARYTLDGQRNPYRMAVTSPREIKAKLVAEWDSATDYTSTMAATAQRLRIEAVGATLGTGTYKCTVDIPGVWDTFTYGESDGVITEELELTAQYDATPAADIAAVVVNAAATLP